MRAAVAALRPVEAPRAEPEEARLAVAAEEARLAEALPARAAALPPLRAESTWPPGGSLQSGAPTAHRPLQQPGQ